MHEAMWVMCGLCVGCVWVVCGLMMITRACQIKLPQKDVDTESVHVSGQDYHSEEAGHQSHDYFNYRFQMDSAVH